MDAHQYVHADVPSGYFSDWMFYYTHHIYMDAHQYVNFDVPSAYFCPWMIYYIRHNNMDACQYVHVDVPSDYPCPWMFHDTCHTYMGGPQCVSPAKKRNGSNITISIRSKRHYKMWFTNHLHKNYITRYVFFIKFHYELQTYLIMVCKQYMNQTLHFLSKDISSEWCVIKIYYTFSLT